MAGPKSPGLRERKKRETRRRIVDVARRLFGEGGYDETSVSEIAEGADIAVSTVFGYFPNKAEIFFAGYEDLIDDFVRALEERGDVSAIEATTAWHQALRRQRASLASDDREAAWYGIARRLADVDPILHAMERDRYARAETSLARAVAEDLGDDPEDLRPQLIAAMEVALMFALSRRLTVHTDGVELGRYTDECLRAAATAIAQVPLPAVSALPAGDR